MSREPWQTLRVPQLPEHPFHSTPHLVTGPDWPRRPVTTSGAFASRGLRPGAIGIHVEAGDSFDVLDRLITVGSTETKPLILRLSIRPMRESLVVTAEDVRPSVDTGANLDKTSVNAATLKRVYDDQTNQGGTFTFLTLADYAAHRPNEYTVQQGTTRVGFWWREYGAFVQDQIKLASNLNVSLGLRYDWQAFFHDHVPVRHERRAAVTDLPDRREQRTQVHRPQRPRADIERWRFPHVHARTVRSSW
jgi:TonB dependent receptor